MSTLKEIFKKINEKLNSVKPELKFDPDSNAMKVINYKYLQNKVVTIFGKWRNNQGNITMSLNV